MAGLTSESRSATRHVALKRPVNQRALAADRHEVELVLGTIIDGQTRSSTNIPARPTDRYGCMAHGFATAQQRPPQQVDRGRLERSLTSHVSSGMCSLILPFTPGQHDRFPALLAFIGKGGRAKDARPARERSAWLQSIVMRPFGSWTLLLNLRTGRPYF